MKRWGSGAAVAAAVREDAAAERERLERENGAEIERLRNASHTRPPAPPDDRLEIVRRSALERDADEEWQTAQAALEDREAWIAEVVRTGRARLSSLAGEDAARWIAALIREGAAHLPTAAFVVTLPVSLAPVCTDAWRQGLEREVGRSFTTEFDGERAGCVLRTPDGRITFDNSAEARERRTLGRWRPALARIYDLAVADVTRESEAVGATRGEGV